MTTLYELLGIEQTLTNCWRELNDKNPTDIPTMDELRALLELLIENYKEIKCKQTTTQ